MYPHHKQVICVKNLPEYSDQIIHHLFGNFGKIISYRFVNTPEPYRKDAIVEFEHPQAPIDARNIHNGRIMNNNKLFIDILPMEQVSAPNNRFAEMNDPRPPFGNRNGNPMTGPDFRMGNQFRNNENNGHFHPQRNENFHMQGPPNNNLNNFRPEGVDIHRNYDMQPRPEIHRGPEHVNNPHMFNSRPGINSSIHPQQNMNFRPVNQAIGYPVPNSPMCNEYRSPQSPMPNMNPARVMANNVQHYPNNMMMSPQQQSANPHNMYSPKPQYENNSHVNRNCISIEENPRTDDAALTAALAKYPELKAQLGNPELIKTIIEICRKEASVMIENRMPNQHRTPIEPTYMNNNRQSPLQNPHHYNHHPNRQDRSRSRSRSRSWSRSRHHNSPKQRQFNPDPRQEYNNYPRSRSPSYSRSRSRSRSCSPVPDAYHNRQQHQPHQHRNRSPIRENRTQHYDRHDYDHKERQYEHRRSPNRSRSPGRDHYRERNRNGFRSRSHDRQRERNARQRYTPEQSQSNNSYKMEFSDGRKVFVIDEDGRKSLTPHFTQKITDSKETGNMMQPIVCEDRDLSLSSTVDSNIDQLNSQELYKHQAGAQKQPLSQQNDKENKISKTELSAEIELKYPRFDHIISKMEAYRENEKNRASYNNVRMDCMAPKKPTNDKKFVYSSRMEVNKESNYPFNPDYDWPLATVLGVYPDDMGSLDFMKNLEGNIRNLLEIPQALPLDIGTFSKNMCDTLLRNENVEVNKTGGDLLDEQGDDNQQEGFLDDLYEVEMDQRGKEKGMTPVKTNYAGRNNFNKSRNRFFGNANMNRFKGRNKPFDH